MNCCVRKQRQIERRVKAAAFRELKPLDEFDWAFNPSIPKQAGLRAGHLPLRAREREDVLLIGPPGTGKSFIVPGHRLSGDQARALLVLYRSIFDVVRDFLHDEAVRRPGEGARPLSQTRLVDRGRHGNEKFYPTRAVKCCSKIIMRRYETRSTMMT